MEFVIDFERRADLPLYRSLSEAIKSAIANGRLTPGQKVPSVRVLSELMDVSRNTAHQCYQKLANEGYIESVQGKGIFVSRSMLAPEPPAPVSSKRQAAAPPASPLTGTLLNLEDSILAQQTTAAALRHQMPAIDDLPLQAIRKALAKHARLAEPSVLEYSGDPFGHPLLREAIANYVTRARAIKCTPEQVVIAARPSQELLDMICRLFLSEKSWVAVENPGYSQPRHIFELHGANVLPIAVDNEGLQVKQLVTENRPVKMVYVTPSHHDPTGAILARSRRQDLLDWAKRTDALIWEDDVDNEYRYGSEPLPALFAMDDDNRVIYQSTFWRTLCPIFRLGFIVLPDNRMKDIVHLARYMFNRDLPILEQLALADLINEGHFERHVRVMRKKFTARRQTAVHTLTIELGSIVNISRTTSGLHLRAVFDPSLSEQFILQCAQDSDLPVTSTRSYYLGAAPTNEFLIKFAHTSEPELTRQAQTFARLLKASQTRA